MIASQPQTTLVLLRHGQTDWNALGRFQGQTDIALNDTGLQQATAAAKAIAGLRPDVLVASPFTRAQQTAGEVAKVTDLPIETDERLSEINCGSWEGLTMDQVTQIDPEFVKALREGRDYRRSPEGETAEETGERWAGAVRDIVETHAGRRIVVVSHGLAMRQGIAKLLGWDYELSQQHGPFDNCSWAILEQHHGGWRVATWNENVQTMMALIEDTNPEQV